MRNIKFVLIVLALITLSSCFLRPWYVEMIVENNTEHEVLIEGFYEGEEKEVIAIKPYDNYVHPQDIHPESRRPKQLFMDYHIDSVNIVFDNDKIIVQSCEKDFLQSCLDIERNILDYGLYYEYEDLGHKKERYTYTITKEDYERAVFIDSLENR